MRQEYICMLAVVLAGLLLPGCDSSGDEHGGRKTYQDRVREAEELKDRAEKLYLDAMSYESATEQRNTLLRKAYDEGEKAMDILNGLDEQFGQRAVPEGEVLAHKPVMKSLSELMDHIVRAMSATD
jgi:hypothetical protein